MKRVYRIIILELYNALIHIKNYKISFDAIYKVYGLRKPKNGS